ncbi:hypothetical protein [Microbaculum marinum]|uniref:DUF115 domain-containing protein n=1 Tax=Microbaculum marinum TaxID=1764581 RepID=A0AAW9S326_9HYPH
MAAPNMTVLLLSNHRALEPDGSEGAAGRLWSALNMADRARILELLPYTSPAGIGLRHPCSRAILARYGRAGVLPEALSLGKRLLREIDEIDPVAICLMDESLLPLAFVLHSARPAIKLLLLSGDAPSPACGDVFAYRASLDPDRNGEDIRSLLDLDDEHLPPHPTGIESLDEHAVFNPLTRFFGARYLYWGPPDHDDLQASLNSSAGNRFDNTSFEPMARGKGWILFQFMAILDEHTVPETATLTVSRGGPGNDSVIYSGTPVASCTTLCAGILTIEKRAPDGFDVQWWFSRAGISAEPTNRDSRWLEIGGRDLLVTREQVGSAGPINIRTPGTAIAFSETERLFNRTGDPDLERYRDVHRGEVAWLVGNGPSVRHDDLERLAGKLTFGFNRLYLAYEKMAFRPTYVVSGDLQMIRDFGEDMVRRSAAPVFLSCEDRPELDAPFTWLRQVTCFPSVFSLDPTSYVTAGGSSVYVAMQLAYFMGVREFYLYGADFRFTYSRTASNGDRNRSAVGDNNHFIKNYRAGRPWSPPELRNISASFLTADIFMRLQGGMVRNATRGGSLEIFERVPFEDAVQAGA